MLKTNPILRNKQAKRLLALAIADRFCSILASWSRPMSNGLASWKPQLGGILPACQEVQWNGLKLIRPVNQLSTSGLQLPNQNPSVLSQPNTLTLPGLLRWWAFSALSKPILYQGPSPLPTCFRLCLRIVITLNFVWTYSGWKVWSCYCNHWLWPVPNVKRYWAII